jgi:hypothetical protein
MVLAVAQLQCWVYDRSSSRSYHRFLHDECVDHGGCPATGRCRGWFSNRTPCDGAVAP